MLSLFGRLDNNSSSVEFVSSNLDLCNVYLSNWTRELSTTDGEKLVQLIFCILLYPVIQIKGFLH